MIDHSGAEIIIGSCFTLVVLIGGVIGALKLMAWWYTRPARRGESARGFEVKLTDKDSVTAKKENDHG
jgi:hypothetical protein